MGSYLRGFWGVYDSEGLRDVFFCLHSTYIGQKRKDRTPQLGTGVESSVCCWGELYWAGGIS